MSKETSDGTAMIRRTCGTIERESLFVALENKSRLSKRVLKGLQPRIDRTQITEERGHLTGAHSLGPTSSADPSGVTMSDKLATERRPGGSLPAVAFDIQPDISEPTWIGSCGEPISRVGWVPVYVNAYCKPHLRGAHVASSLARRFRETGWNYDGDPAVAGDGAVVDTMPVAWILSWRPEATFGANVSTPIQ